MNVCIDVGNTTISLGFYKDGKIFGSFCLGTNENYTSDELVAALKPLLREHEIITSEAEKIIYSSVVPNIDNSLKEAIIKIFDKEMMIVKPGIKTGLIIKVDNPNEVGGDLIADLVGAKERVGYPVLIVDLGTASKILYLDEKGAFSNCVIMPGLDISKSVLASKTALLPEIGFKQPKNVLNCHNTVDAMNAGVIYSHAYGIAGIVKKYYEEIGHEVPTLLTGGVSLHLKDYLPDYIYDPTLTLDGLEIILEKQK